MSVLTSTFLRYGNILEPTRCRSVHHQKMTVLSSCLGNEMSVLTFPTAKCGDIGRVDAGGRMDRRQQGKS